MNERHSRWLSTPEAARILGTTCTQICQWLNIGRLSGKKLHKPGSRGVAKWRVDPKSVAKERRSIAKSSRLKSK